MNVPEGGYEVFATRVKPEGFCCQSVDEKSWLLGGLQVNLCMMVLEVAKRKKFNDQVSKDSKLFFRSYI